MHHWQCLYTSKVHKKQPFEIFTFSALFMTPYPWHLSLHSAKWKKFFSIGKTFICTVGVNIKVLCKMRISQLTPPPWASQLPLSKYRWLSEASNSFNFHFQKNESLPTPTTGPSDETNQALYFISDQSCFSSHLKLTIFIVPILNFVNAGDI